MSIRLLMPIAILTPALASATPPLPPGAALPNSPGVDVVRSAIAAGGAACSRGDTIGPMAAVDRDLVLSYPGAKDIGYDELAAAYRRLCDGKSTGSVQSTVPEFEDVSQIGDVVFARLVWSTHLRGTPEGNVRKMRDVQIWRRTLDGWRFWRGVHWRYTDEQPK